MGEFVELFAWGDTGWGDQLFFGAVVTVQVAFVSYALGLALGLAGAGARLSHSRIVRLPAFGYSIVFRGLPELLIISLIYFGGSLAIRAVLAPFGIRRYVEFDPFLSGVLALGLVIGAYVTELLRGAILSVSPGQGDAARALGLGRVQVFCLIVLPQAFRIALPGLSNLWMTNLKNTALLSVIGLVDMVRAAYFGAASTRNPLPFFTAIALGYLVLTYASQIILARLEGFANRGMAEPAPKTGSP